MSINLDAMDRKILATLMQDSRISYTQLAKKINSSREVAAYRIRRLQEGGILQEFVTEIDTEKLGFKLASLFLSIKANKEEEFREYLKKCTFAAWTSEFSGVWNFGVGIYGKTIEEIHNRFSAIQEKFGEYIIDHRMTIHYSTSQYYEKYLNLDPIRNVKKKKNHDIDSKDKIILKELSRNARMDCVSLARKVDLTAVAIATRIRKLEQSGIIARFSIFIDPSRLGLYQFSIFIKSNAGSQKKIINHLKAHPKISFVIEYIGNPFIEFGVIVNDPYEMRRIVQEIESLWPENRVIESFLIQKEILSIGLPACVFE